MLSPSDAWGLLTIIKHIDGRDVAEADAGLWASTINAALPEVTVGQCRNAIAEWQSRQHDYSRIQPYDIISIVKSHRPSSLLTEAEIGRMLEPLDLTADELWAARRELIAGVNSGMPRDRALARALDAAHGRQLPSKPSKPMPTHVHRFAGSGKLRIRDVIGGDPR